MSIYRCEQCEHTFDNDRTPSTLWYEGKRKKLICLHCWDENSSMGFKSAIFKK